MPPDSKQKGKKRKHHRNNNVNKRKKNKSDCPVASGSQKENIKSPNNPEKNEMAPLEDVEIINRQTPPNIINPEPTFDNFNDRQQPFENEIVNDEIIRLFDKIRYSEEAASALPNRSWAIHCTDIPVKRIVVSEMVMNNLPGKGLEPFYTKQIVFDDKLSYELFLLTSKTILQDKPSSIQSMTEFESLLDHVERLKLCSGGPDVVKYNNINPECAYKDSRNKWRHNLCTLELNDDENDTCEACLSLEDILKRHVQRLKPSLKCRTGSNMITRRKRPGQSRGS